MQKILGSIPAPLYLTLLYYLRCWSRLFLLNRIRIATRRLEVEFHR